MDLSQINADNVHQLAVQQIEQIIRYLFSAEEWANMSQFEKSRYRILLVEYVRNPEIQRTKTLEEFIKERTDPPSDALSILGGKRQCNEDEILYDTEDPSFKIPPSPKKKCFGTSYSESQLYNSTGTFLAPKRQTVIPTVEVPSTSGLHMDRRQSTESVSDVQYMDIDTSDDEDL